MGQKSKLRVSVATFAAVLFATSLCGAAEKGPTTLAGGEGLPKTLTDPSPTSCKCDCLVGYGAPLLSVSRLASQTALLLGARGGAVLKRRFVLGAGGFTLLNKLTMPSSAQLGPGDHKIKYGAAGFWFAYILGPEWVVHPTFGVLLGGGSVAYRATDKAPGAPETDATSSFFMAQPEVEVDVNVTRFMRVGVGVYYRIIAGVDLEDKLKNGDVSGPGALLAVKFGVY